MFSHDPFQSYSAFTPYIGAPQFGFPHFGQAHPGLNPLAQNPLASLYGGIHPLQLQAIAAQAAIQQLQNPLLAQLYQNPLLGAGIGQHHPLLALQNPLLNPMSSLSPFGQLNPYQSLLQQSPYQQSPYQQSPYQQSPYQQSPLQQISPFSQLQPQSWVGQPYGAVNPLLQQFAQRGQGGMNPWSVS